MSAFLKMYLRVLSRIRPNQSPMSPNKNKQKFIFVKPKSVSKEEKGNKF